MLRTFLLLLMLVAGPSGPAAASLAVEKDARIAFLGLVFIDTSTEGAYFGVREDETARMGLLEDAVRDRFAEEGYAFMDLAPIEGELAATVNPADCYGCDIRMGRKLGAEYILVGEVQKVSNLILAMNLVLRDVASGGMVAGRAVDIRSNTDESWLRGMTYLMTHYFFEE